MQRNSRNFITFLIKYLEVMSFVDWQKEMDETQPETAPSNKNSLNI